MTRFLIIFILFPWHLHAQCDTLFYEDFSNGMLGSTQWGAWNDYDAYGNDVWVEADGATPLGEYPDDPGPLLSETAANGWVIFDASQFQIFQTDPLPLWGFLISPVIEIEPQTSIVIEWTQYFRYCCGWESPLFLEVSINEGESWESFPAHGDFVETSDWTSENPMHMSIDVSCFAADASNIQLRFAFNPQELEQYGYDFWGIDDVLLRCAADSDIPSFHEIGIRSVDSPFQMRKMLAGTSGTEEPLNLDVFLTGHTFVDSEILQLEVFKDGSAVYESSFDIESQDSCTINPFHSVSITLDSPISSWESEVVGDYTFVAQLFDPLTESTASAVSAVLTISPTGVANLLASQIDSPIETYGEPELPVSGAWISMPSDSICALEISSWESTAWGQTALNLFDQEPEASDPFFSQTQTFNDAPAGILSVYPDAPLTLSEPNTLITITPSILSVAGTYGRDVYRQNRQWIWNRMEEVWEWQHGAFMPYVGFETALCEHGLVSDPAQASSIYPNPSSGEARIKSPLNIEQIVIYNAVGQRVGEIRLDSQESITLDLNFLSEGVYFLYFLGVNEYWSNRLLIQK